jgi:hypothetical protein
MTGKPDHMSEHEWMMYQAGQRAGALAELAQRQGLFLARCEKDNARRERTVRDASPPREPRGEDAVWGSA